MASKRVFFVFVLPVVLSLIFGGVVLSDILQKPGRELHLMPSTNFEISVSHNISNTSNAPIEIIGLAEQYTTSTPVKIQVKINDSSFSCGDLYVTIFPSGKDTPITQGGFLEQCFESGNPVLPIDDQFSEIIDTPGSYEIVTQMISKQLKNISTEETFTVK